MKQNCPSWPQCDCIVQGNAQIDCNQKPKKQMKKKFSKAQMKKIEALMRKYQISKNEAAQMYARSGF